MGLVKHFFALASPRTFEMQSADHTGERQGRRNALAEFSEKEDPYNAPMQLADALIEWFQTNARPLPWRTEPRDPYRSLVSEIMLQQTQVDRVVDRFEAFVKRFPTVVSLACADEEEVLALWSGLGYYRRARMLHSLAQVVYADHGGVLPDQTAQLRSLPGVGEYTAAAVASMVHGRKEPVVDGNVRRVGARVLAFDGDSRSMVATRRFQAWIRELMVDRPPGIVNEALMELGATLCTPREPRCPECPLKRSCVARNEGLTAAIPSPRSVRAVEHLHWVAACCVRGDGRWLVRRVESGPILQGLWLPPLADLGHEFSPYEAAKTLLPALIASEVEAFPAVRHSITHRRIDVVPVRVLVTDLEVDAATWRWIDPAGPGLATSSLLGKLWKSING